MIKILILFYPSPRLQDDKKYQGRHKTDETSRYKMKKEYVQAGNGMPVHGKGL
jgi:hypothetical protein